MTIEEIKETVDKWNTTISKKSALAIINELINLKAIDKDFANRKVPEIRIGDIIYVNTGLCKIPHFHIVLKVFTDSVLACTITHNPISKNYIEFPNIRELSSDKQQYISLIPIEISMEHAKNSFYTIFTDKKFLKLLRSESNKFVKTLKLTK